MSMALPSCYLFDVIAQYSLGARWLVFGLILQVLPGCACGFYALNVEKREEQQRVKRKDWARLLRLGRQADWVQQHSSCNLIWLTLDVKQDMGLHRYAAKMGSEGAAMYEAAEALAGAMGMLGLACDGGKDSLSMAAAAGGEVGHLGL